MTTSNMPELLEAFGNGELILRAAINMTVKEKNFFPIQGIITFAASPSCSREISGFF
jgi:hypothetical protein